MSPLRFPLPHFVFLAACNCPDSTPASPAVNRFFLTFSRRFVSCFTSDCQRRGAYMKTWERLIVYPILCVALIYGLWAHNTLHSIYRINKSRPPLRQEEPLPTDITSLTASRYPDLAVPRLVTCTRYLFEIEDKSPEEWTFRWSAWIHNPQPYWLGGAYFIEFRNSNGSLLDLVGPIPATFPTTQTPREANSRHTLPVYLASQVDLSKSSVFILEKK